MVFFLLLDREVTTCQQYTQKAVWKWRLHMFLAKQGLLNLLNCGALIKVITVTVFNHSQ